MAVRAKSLTRLLALTGVASPTLALAHGTDHLHFWGHHTADGQVSLIAVVLLAVAGLAWWLWRSRG